MIVREPAAVVEGVSLSQPQIVAELSVVIPTYNEVDNIPVLLDRLERVLDGVRWEAVFVDDDSGDGTSRLVRAIALFNPRVRCIRRVGRRGLSSACIEGILATSAPYVAVMDADLQHDEALLPSMLERLRARRELDLVVGSRYTAGGGVGDWSRARRRISDLSGRLGRAVLRCELSDPMSGFFMLRREAFEEAVHRLSGQGFKILVDLFASAPRPLRFEELPYRFRLRERGESKLDSRVAGDYLLLLMDKTVGRYVPVTFLQFAAVGALGVLVHLAALALLMGAAGTSFLLAQELATLVAMVSNYTLNNAFTYRDRRRRGRRWFTGLLSFCLICGLGAVANVGVAEMMVRDQSSWWLAGAAGAVVGAVWNYAMSAAFTWRTRG